MTYEAAVSEFDTSLASVLMARVIDAVGPERAHEALDAILEGMAPVELAALAYDWPNVWARPKQLPPAHRWESWGKLEGRGTGKTIGNSKWVNEEAESGRAMLICLAAQDEDNAVKLQVTGPSGLLATAKPWFRPEFHIADLEVVWPNGAKAYVRTPERPGKIRGLEYHLSWICELQSWPTATRDEAYMNVLLSTRLGYARIIWDATAKRRHPLLRTLLKLAEADPKRNVVVSGSTRENRLNLGVGYLEKLEAKLEGTQQGEEELHGRMSMQSEGATTTDAIIERNRRAVAGPLRRRVLSVDPAVTAHKGSDSTGIIDAGLTVDGKAAILGDHTGKHVPEAWGPMILDLYVAGQCDLVIVETNKGGHFLVSNLRAAAADRKLAIVVIGKTERAPGHQRGIVHVREIYSKGEKADRARPTSTALEKNRVVFVGPHPDLEDVLTTWEPVAGARSPDRLDAMVGAVEELLELTNDEPDPKAAVAGLAEANRKIVVPRAPDVSRLRGGSGRGGGGRI